MAGSQSGWLVVGTWCMEYGDGGAGLEPRFEDLNLADDQDLLHPTFRSLMFQISQMQAVALERCGVAPIKLDTDFYFLL